MGKKVKKKAKSVQKEKRSPAVSETVTHDDGEVLFKDGGLCCHIEKGINLGELSTKICPSESMRCEDCGGRAKVKGKQGKKGVNSKSESKAIWICLECGHFSCGGVGLPTTPQTHAVKHSKQNHHPLTIHYENHQLIWCFRCSRLVAGKKSEESSKHKEVLHEVVKLLKGGPGEGTTVDVEDVWFGSGSALATKSDYSISTTIDGDRRAGYLVRGLVNLGNTCFFNSILQNLLAINSLRDYFVKSDASVGPLTASLRKLFLETSCEVAVKGTINPRSLFGNVCTKAPQFRGFQQHDSHELLRCLIDGLSTEELSAGKHAKSTSADEMTPTTDPTFVDIIFGGKLASTVTCLECGHSSTTYEPVLDLSLPVPNKKPQSIRTQPVTRGKKPKLPPKRTGKMIRPKVNRDLKSFPVGSVSENSTGVSDKSMAGNSCGEVESRVQHAEPSLFPSCDPSLSDATDSSTMAQEMGLTPQDLSAIQSPEKQRPDLSDSCAWLDYLDPTPVSKEIDIGSKTDEIPVNQGSANEDILHNDVSSPITLESGTKSDLEHGVSEKQQPDLPDTISGLDYVGPKIPVSSEIDIGSEMDEIPVNQGSTSEDVLHNDVSLPINLESGTMSDLRLAVSEASLDNAKQLQFDSPEQGTVARHEAGVSECEDEKNAISQSDSASCHQYHFRSEDPNFDNENPCKENISSKVQISNRDTTGCSSAVISDEQDSSNFNGFGDMFNEPESTSEIRHETNDAIVISSDSDPGEVDNVKAPVSVESCLYLFTKPEHLSKDEHAWQCDNCSKILSDQMIKSRRKLRTNGLEILPNGCDGRNGVADTSYENSLPQTSEIHLNGDCIPENLLETEMNVITCQPETRVHNEINGGHEKRDSELSEEDAKSKNLKVKRDATKRILINKAPSILTINLKRFCPDARGRLSKLNGHVNFRETIDLKPYMDLRCIDRETYTYRLAGVVEHSGTMRGGHYVAYVRGGTTSCNGGRYTWYNASDGYVRQVSLEEVLASEAYILFYERI